MSTGQRLLKIEPGRDRAETVLMKGADTETEARIPRHNPFLITCFKYQLLVFNLVFVIAGTALLCVTTLAHYAFADYVRYMEDELWPILSLCYFVGAAIFLTGAIGCGAGWCETYKVTITYCALMTLLFLLTSAAASAIIAFEAVGKAEWRVERFMLKSMDRVQSGRIIMDAVQVQLQCCGAKGYMDWFKTPFHTIRNESELDIPGSCCLNATRNFSFTQPDDSCGYELDTEAKAIDSIYTEGCGPKVARFIRENLKGLGAVGIIVIVLEILGFTCGCCFLHQLRRKRKEREMMEQYERLLQY
ncbi:PREDICTED: CD63 antigen-like isoform X4 [Branchiostoma belcheri]|uniref:Tetraspanin n=1 Tax=Branchiostoma belcheri TaxID=7741 RepID=A0A6P4YAX1_BRABE|nr:PREDICTED: CD63 antigen-like isoform X4 [Branchiostoma belcheri]